MFNNRQSGRRFRLGNLARLVQLRQSVSYQPPPPPRKTLQETLSQSPPQTPPFQPQPPSFPSPIPSTSTLPPSFLESGEDSGSPPHVPPEPKSSPLSLKSKEEPQSQPQPMPMPPLISEHVKTHRNLLIQSPPMSPPESAVYQSSVPPPTLTPEAKTLLSPPSTLKATGEFQSQPIPPLPPVICIDETRFQSPLPPQISSPSLSESGESHMSSPPPKAKAPPSSPLTFDATEEFQSQTSPPLPPSTSINETRLRPSQESKTPPSSPSTLNGNEVFKSQTSPPLPPSKFTDETQLQSSPPPLPPPKAKFQSSALNATEELQSQPPLPLLPSASINETQFRSLPSSLSETGEAQPLLLPPERKTPPSPPSTQNSTAESLPQPLTPSKSIKETQFRSSSHASSPSLSESGEPQLPLPPPEAKTSPSTQNATEKFQPHLPPKSIDESRFQSPLPLQASPPSLSKSGESQPPLEAKTPPSMLKANEGFQSQTSPPPLPCKSISETQFRSIPPSLSPPEAKTLNAIEKSQSQLPPPLKSTDETRFQSPASSQTSLPNSVEPQSSLPQSEAKDLLSSPSMLNANEDFRSETSPPPLMPPKSSDETRSHSPSSNNTDKPKSVPPLLIPKAAENLRSQSPMPAPSLTALSPMITPIPSPAATTMAPPSLSSPLKPQIIPSPEPSLPQIKPNQVESSSPKQTNTEAHTSPDHKKDLNYNPDKVNAKIPTWNEETETGNRGKAVWTEKKTEPTMMMFINSNVQGFNTSLALDSSSIDHEPGVHLTIDSDQSCEFSSKVF